MKRMAIVWFVESLFGSPGKRPSWDLLLVCAGIAMAALMIVLRFTG
jgi:hypothetical protein